MVYRDNSKWWNHILLPIGRASRLEFNLILLCLAAPLIYVIYQLKAGTHYTESFLTWLLVYVVIMLYIGICATIRRNHDMGNAGLSRRNLSGWEFIFKKGDNGINVYGSNPGRDYDSQVEEFKEYLSKINYEGS